MQYECDDCGRIGSPRMLGRVLVCTCGSAELRWRPLALRLYGLDEAPTRPEARLERQVEVEEADR